MSTETISEAQRKAAKVVGFTYLFAMATSVFGELYARAHLIVASSAAETARNIIDHERLWRLGIASSLLCFLADVALITALYVILKEVNKNLALFATFMRVVETAIAVVVTLNSFDVLRLLSGADYLQALTPDQLHGLARISISAYGSGLTVDFVFLGIGSTVFCYLWFKSHYIPRFLAALGIFGSLLLAVGSFGIIIFPNLARTLSLAYMAPLGVFEITIGFWLLLKRLRPSVPGNSNGTRAYSA